jgi:phosphatidylserine decarboxylase
LFSEIKKLPIYLRVYAALPLRFFSQCWGYVNDLILPVWARSPVYRLYTFLFGCNLNEMKTPIDQLSSFQNLGEFFFRELKEGARPIDSSRELVSPSDGRILQCGKMIDGEICKVKNASYLASNLMGMPIEPPQSWLSYLIGYLMGWKHKKSASYEPWSSSNDLYYAVIYLAPGDYHRFHSPASWNIKEFRHFYGEMFSVSPWLVSKFPTLFTLNERVACVGNWNYGFFGMTAVAATNVGKIKINALPVSLFKMIIDVKGL